MSKIKNLKANIEHNKEILMKEGKMRIISYQPFDLIKPLRYIRSLQLGSFYGKVGFTKFENKAMGWDSKNTYFDRLNLDKLVYYLNHNEAFIHYINGAFEIKEVVKQPDNNDG